MTFATLGSMALHGTEPVTGVRWVVSRDQFSGWDDGPASTVAAQQKPRSHGAWTGGAQHRAMHPVLGGMVYAPTEDALLDARDRLKAACTLEPTVLTIVQGSSSRWAMVQREDEVLFRSTSPTSATWSLQLLAADPRKFGAELTKSTGLPSSTGGLTAPFTAPFTVDAVTVTGQVSLTNPGNATGPVRLRIDGPANLGDPALTGPIITHVGSGLVLVFASSLALAHGDYVTVDMEAHAVLAQGQSDRGGWITSRGWSGFEPGANTWSFSAVSGSGLLTVIPTEAWE